MIEVTSTRILATLLCAAFGVFAFYVVVTWLAYRASNAVDTTRRPERRARRRRVLYQERCSTFRELNGGEFAVIVAVAIALGVFLLLSTTWIGQEFMKYLARVFRLPV